MCTRERDRKREKFPSAKTSRKTLPVAARMNIFSEKSFLSATAKDLEKQSRASLNANLHRRRSNLFDFGAFEGTNAHKSLSENTAERETKK